MHISKTPFQNLVQLETYKIMLKVLFWYMLERLVKIPTFMLMTLHELLISKVMKVLGKVEEKVCEVILLQAAPGRMVIRIHFSFTVLRLSL